ncbi:hypothetical protein HU200_048017 [Digitaria exilis]|uniref:Uncharacterized protein n=1 Tax=Digitaria exilis TaxID=1010633 RepID=A0A835E813_9POAL|nr:hypothetical protein HU200_048017 [Digitaria exilis]CAB3486508.1 unnamed protein product [Digitaria exilis]
MAAAHLTIRDVLYFYSDARNVYERFMAMGSHQEQARNAVALLLWLDPTHHQAIRHLPSLSRAAVGIIAAETNSILDCLRQEGLVLPPIPFISALYQEAGIEVDADFLAFNQDLVVRGVADILDAVGALIFGDHIYRLLRCYQTGLVGRLPELEAPYMCPPVTVPEDRGSMFVTLSKGKWGDCIVRVLMEKTMRGKPPMYGRIIFKSEAFVSLVLNGEPLVKIAIGYRQLSLRKYILHPHNM